MLTKDGFTSPEFPLIAQPDSVTRRVYTFICAKASYRYVLVMAMLLALPSLWSGIVADDYYHAVRFKNPDFLLRTDDNSLFGLFSVSDGQPHTVHRLVSQGLMPWWTDPAFKFQMLRPLSEISHWIDYRLWPDQFWLMHLHQCILFLIMLVLVHRFFVVVLPGPSLVALSFTLFALSANQSQLVVWLASRNTILGLIFGLACFLSHVRGRQQSGMGLPFLSWLFFALALASSEFGLGCGAWLFAWTLCLDKGSMHARMLRLIPFGLIALFWAYFYVEGQQGVAGTQTYIDPLHSPAAYLFSLMEKIPLTVFQIVFGIPVSFFGGTDMGRSGWVIAALLTASVAWLLRQQLRDARWRFLLVGAALSLIPVAAGPAGGRTLGYVGLGLFPFLALLIREWAESPQGSSLPRALRVIGSAAVFLFVLGLLATPVTAAMFKYNNDRNFLKPALQLPLDDARDQVVMVLNPNSAMFSIFYPLLRAEAGLRSGQYFYTAASGQKGVRVLREGPASLVVSPADGYLASRAEYFTRPKHKAFKAGDQMTFPGLDIEILTLTADGRPQDVRFTFAHNLDAPELNILVCDQMKYATMQSLQIGQAVTLPPCDR